MGKNGKVITGLSGGVDNAMRGRSGGHPKLIFFSEKAILKWCFQSLQLSLVHLEVLSFNAMSIELHSEFGFTTDLKLPLRKENRDGDILHLPVRAPEANVDYTCNRMTLTKERYMSSCESVD